MKNQNISNKLAYSPTEAAQAIGVSRTKMYDLLKTDGFPSRRIGGRIVIPADALKRWLEAGDANDAV